MGKIHTKPNVPDVSINGSLAFIHFLGLIYLGPPVSGFEVLFVCFYLEGKWLQQLSVPENVI